MRIGAILMPWPPGSAFKERDHANYPQIAIADAHPSVLALGADHKGQFPRFRSGAGGDGRGARRPLRVSTRSRVLPDT